MGNVSASGLYLYNTSVGESYLCLQKNLISIPDANVTLDNLQMQAFLNQTNGPSFDGKGESHRSSCPRPCHLIPPSALHDFL